jgi:putative addiction module component (TIGR02574 family)
MARTMDDIWDELKALTIEQRSLLAEWLLDSLSTAEELEIEEEWVVEAERRVAEVEAGTARLIPAEDVMRELRAKYEPHRRSR